MMQKIDPVMPGEIELPSSNTQLNSGYNYKYQGQERQDELGLNWDSFRFRNYDYAIGRFMSIDPLAEQYDYNSTYAFQENKMGMGRELEGLELDQSPRFGPNVRYINPSDTQTVHNAQNVLKGTGNVVFGAVGAIGSALYSAGTLGAGAALGGGVAFTLSIAEISLGICQINDALSNDSSNVPLQSSSSLPGFVAYSNNNSNAPVIDGVGAFIPGLLSGGNIMGIIEAPNTIMSSTSGTNAAFNLLNATDAVLDTQSAVQGISQFQPVSFPSSITTTSSQTPSSSTTQTAPTNPFSMYPTQFVQPPAPKLNIPRN
jgi:RHS repeat-associated protein